MGKANRRWLWLLLPLLGIGATLALPPLDEYAPLDHIGDRFDPAEDGRMSIPPGAPAGFREDVERLNRENVRMARELDEKLGIARRRAWKVDVPETEARRTFGRLFATRARWRNLGGGTGSVAQGERRSTIVSSTYTNDETGDRADVAFKAQIAPTRGPTSIKVEIAQTKASLQPWALARRWARRTVGL